MIINVSKILTKRKYKKKIILLTITKNKLLLHAMKQLNDFSGGTELQTTEVKNLQSYLWYGSIKALRLQMLIMH